MENSDTDESFDLSAKNNRHILNDSSLSNHHEGIFKNKAVYGKYGRSLGNKFLISLPILNIVVPFVFLIFSYVYAEEKHKSFLPPGNSVPFISDIGDKRPQSSLFTFGMTLSSYTTFGVVVTRFWQIKHFLVKFDNRMNYISLALGLILILGKLLVVSFQLSSERAVHFVGAGMYVIFATAYAVTQTLISYKNKTLYGKYQTVVMATRIALLAGMCVGTILFGIFLIPELTKYNRQGFSVAQSGEWLFACAKCLYFLTFVVDFWPLHPKLLLIKLERNRSRGLVLPNMNNTSALPMSDQKYASKTEENC